MKVTFRGYGQHLASTRLRAIVPAQQLYALGVGTGNDWLILGKHGWDWDEQTEGFSKVCYDVCDNWFHSQYDAQYRTNCQRADLITCSSRKLVELIREETGREAVFIPEPWEQPERKPRVSDKLLWFGFRNNLHDLKEWVEDLKPWPLEIVSDLEAPGITIWSPEAMDQAYDRAGLVIIPTGASEYKSGNRAIDSIRRGLYPVCGVLDSYADLGVYQGDIVAGILWALAHREEVLCRIRASQRYVAQEYSPQRIGRLWLKALSG